VTKVADMSVDHGDSAPVVNDIPQADALQKDGGAGPTLQALPSTSSLPEVRFKR
jgi:hypothetical protein